MRFNRQFQMAKLKWSEFNSMSQKTKLIMEIQIQKIQKPM